MIHSHNFSTDTIQLIMFHKLDPLGPRKVPFVIKGQDMWPQKLTKKELHD